MGHVRDGNVLGRMVPEAAAAGPKRTCKDTLGQRRVCAAGLSARLATPVPSLSERADVLHRVLPLWSRSPAPVDGKLRKLREQRVAP